jgi:hypothetical protein
MGNTANFATKSFTLLNIFTTVTRHISPWHMPSTYTAARLLEVFFIDGGSALGQAHGYMP